MSFIELDSYTYYSEITTGVRVLYIGDRFVTYNQEDVITLTRIIQDICTNEISLQFDSETIKNSTVISKSVMYPDYKFTVELDGNLLTQLETKTKEFEKKKLTCECGAEKANTTHAIWCHKYEEK